jgi:hypothetical protein
VAFHRKGQVTEVEVRWGWRRRFSRHLRLRGGTRARLQGRGCVMKDANWGIDHDHERMRVTQQEEQKTQSRQKAGSWLEINVYSLPPMRMITKLWALPGHIPSHDAGARLPRVEPTAPPHYIPPLHFTHRVGPPSPQPLDSASSCEGEGRADMHTHKHSCHHAAPPHHPLLTHVKACFHVAWQNEAPHRSTLPSSAQCRPPARHPPWAEACRPGCPARASPEAKASV